MSPDLPRVVITGMGAVTALGQGVPSTWGGLVAGRSGVARITQFDPAGVSPQIAAEVKDFDPSAVLDRKDIRRTDRYIQLALLMVMIANIAGESESALDLSVIALTASMSISAIIGLMEFVLPGLSIESDDPSLVQGNIGAIIDRDSIDGVPVADGKPGKMTTMLYDALAARIYGAVPAGRR